MLDAEEIKKYRNEEIPTTKKRVDQTIADILKQHTLQVQQDPAILLSLLDFSVPVFTTNFDSSIEEVIAQHDVEGYDNLPLTFEDENQIETLFQSPLQDTKKLIFKAHGSVNKIGKLIFDEHDYFELYTEGKWPIALKFIRHVLATKLVVYIGYSTLDPEFRALMQLSKYQPSTYPR